jgi:EmrB/QacA subfamily drug resistance transporter
VALVVLCVGQLMIVLDATVVNVALPSIQRDLHSSTTSLAWVINGYLITFGGLLMLAGRLDDLLGRKRVFLSGVALFTLASLLCGAAPTQETLIAARFLQGVGAAVVSSMVLAILVTLFVEPRELGKAMGIYAFVASAGGSIGLLAGGVLTQVLSWHWIFFINLPIGALALALGSALIPRQAAPGPRSGIDFLGAILVTAAPGLAVYVILEAGQGGIALPSLLGLGSLVVALTLAFVLVESRVRHPLVPLRVFRSRNVVGANLVRALLPVGLFGAFFLGALYLQRVLGFSPVQTGFAFLPMNLGVAVFSLLITARLVTRFGAKSVLVPGLLLVAAGLALFSHAPVQGSYLVDVLPSLALIGIGAGLVFMPSVSLAMAGAGPGDAGLASGLANVALQVGAAIGIAALASIASAQTSGQLADGSGFDAALTSGYHLGFVVAAASAGLAAVLASLVLRGAPHLPREVPAAHPEAARTRELVEAGVG